MPAAPASFPSESAAREAAATLKGDIEPCEVREGEWILRRHVTREDGKRVIVGYVSRYHLEQIAPVRSLTL